VAELIVAFDLPSGREALDLAARLPGLRWAKIGPILHVREGPALVREFAARGVRVFLDLKWHDIPSVAAAGDMALLGVTVLTSHDAGDFERVMGRGVPDLGFEAERLGRLAVAAGLRGVVASGHELALLRATLGPEPWIVVPGVRAPGEAAEDQARTIAVPDAVRGGATHLVVGRPITRAADPRGVYQRLMESL